MDPTGACGLFPLPMMTRRTQQQVNRDYPHQVAIRYVSVTAFDDTLYAMREFCQNGTATNW